MKLTKEERDALDDKNTMIQVEKSLLESVEDDCYYATLYWAELLTERAKVITRNANIYCDCDDEVRQIEVFCKYIRGVYLRRKKLRELLGMKPI